MNNTRTNYFTQSMPWEEFLEANPLLQVDLANPVSSTDLVQDEAYVFLNAPIPTYDTRDYFTIGDDHVPIIHKVIFRGEIELMGHYCVLYCFEIEPDGSIFSVKESELISDVLLYKYTEEVPCK